jgi:hypothetical protein
MRNLAVLLLCLAVFILSGCATTSKDKQSSAAALESQPLLKFSDVPVPMGFRSLPHGSYSFESSNVRVGVLKYQGKADAEQVVNFYKEQMPMYNWFLLNAVEYGDRILNFDRENETCIVNLQPRGNNVIVTISLGPKSQVPSKKAKKPIK